MTTSSLLNIPVGALNAAQKLAESQAATISSSGAVAGPGFQTYLTSSTGGSVSSAKVTYLDLVGAPVASNTPENFAIAGKGFAMVRNLPGNTADGQGTLGFTRIGTFKQDASGNIQNENGQYLQVFLLDQTTGLPISTDTTSTSALTTLSVGGLVQEATATTTAAFKTQLSANAPVGAEFPQTMQVFDSLGVAHTVTLTWTKQANPGGVPAGATQQWNVTVTAPDGTVNGSDYTGGGLPVYFNSAGNPIQFGNASSTQPPPLPIAWANSGAAASSITLNFGDFNQNNGITALGPTNTIISNPVINGSQGGKFKSMDIKEDGVVHVTFTNDKTVPYARIPVANFNNANGLTEITPGVFGVTGRSGPLQITFPGVNGAGRLAPGQYESSASDSTKSYIGLIETSRYFSNNIKVIQAIQKLNDKLDQI